MLFFYSFIPSSIPWENVFLTFVGDTHTGCSATSMSPGLYALAEAWPVLALGLVLWPALTKSMSAPCLVSLSNQDITRFAISSSIFLSLFHCTGCVLCKKEPALSPSDMMEPEEYRERGEHGCPWPFPCGHSSRNGCLDVGVSFDWSIRADSWELASAKFFLRRECGIRV